MKLNHPASHSGDEVCRAIADLCRRLAVQITHSSGSMAHRTIERNVWSVVADELFPVVSALENQLQP